MPGKIFVNYRRDDARDMAARIRDRLAATFGDDNIFMDVDNLLAGQRFDRELEKALAETDVFLAVIGPRWHELLAERRASVERDYVHEEIAGALQRGIVVIPVLIERTPLPRTADLPEDIRDLVLHQKHTVTHERFGRDVEDLVQAIRFARKPAWPGAGGQTARWIGAAALAVLLLVVGGVWIATRGPGGETTSTEQAAKSKADAEEAARKKAEEEARAKRAAEEAEGRRLAALKVEEDRKGAEAAAKKKAEDEAQAKRAAAEEAERERLAVLKAEQDRRRAEEQRKRTEVGLLQPGREFRDCTDVCPTMVVLPAGEFIMGSTDSNREQPPHRVTIQRPFAVGKFEVTFAEYDACTADGGCTYRPSDQGWGRGRRPVINVSWHDAKEYVAWLSRKSGKTYRLLSEAEWEYAARAGTTTRYAFGDTISKSQAQYGADRTAEVGSFAANKFGLHDMHGNVREWVADNWHYDYMGAPLDGTVWQGGNVYLRVLRGGSWKYVVPDGLRSALRFSDQPTDRGNDDVGFRVSRTL
jgi:formylglycine-generating enzyme required for sulfatase activity